MSTVNAELEQIKTARSSLQKFRMKLLRPSAATLESGSADLAVALDCLKRLEPVMSSGGQRTVDQQHLLRLEVSSLRRELQQVNALMEGASHFYQGWSRLLSSASDDAAANYAANGKVRAQIPNNPNHVVIHG